MKTLLVGVGGVGEAIAVIAKTRPFVEKVVLSDYNFERCKEVQAKLGDPERFPIEWVDAGKQELVEELARKYKADLIMNACDPSLNVPIFEAAYNYGCTYMDMAMTKRLGLLPLKDALGFSKKEPEAEPSAAD